MFLDDPTCNVLTNYMINDSNMPVVILDEDWMIVNHNRVFSDLITYKTKLAGVSFKQILEIDSIINDKKSKSGYIVKKINCTLSSQSGTVTKFHGALIENNGFKYVVFEQYLLSEFKIVEELSKLNIEMSNLTRELAKKNNALEVANVRINKIINTDYLTGIYNRRYFFEQINDLISLNKRKSYYKIGLIQADIDFFKKINDTYGHDVGDLYLIEFAKMISDNLRVEDLVARIGGEEFFVLVKCDTEDMLINVAEKLRVKCEEIKVNDFELKFTASFGASIYQEWEKVDSLIKRVDIALYKAKETGRNKVVVE